MKIPNKIREQITDSTQVTPVPGHSFGNIQETILNNFNISTNTKKLNQEHIGTSSYDTVICLLIDGFGYRQLRDITGHELFDNFRVGSSVLTSIYPSETAAALTSFHTNTHPEKHGIFGWNVYDPVEDTSFKYFNKQVNSGGNIPENYRLVDPVYAEIKELNPIHIVPDTISGFDSVTNIHYDKDSVEQGAEIIGNNIDKTNYMYWYIPHLDTLGHLKGSKSLRYKQVAYFIFDMLYELLRKVSKENTLVILTADHGQITPKEKIKIDNYNAIMDRLKTHKTNEKIKLVGSPRNVHLHVRKESIDEVKQFIQDNITENVHTRNELVENIVGKNTCQTVKNRIGDLVITHEDTPLWYSEESNELKQVGYHGGFHKDEMLVPFFAGELNDF